MKKLLALALGPGTALMLAACADQPTNQSQQYPQGTYSQVARTGTVERIEVVNRKDPNNIFGTVVGGIVGGLIGHQIGGGSGQTAATIIGAAGGAYAGNQIQQRQRADHESFRVTVRFDDGTYQTIEEKNFVDLRTGDRVRVEGNTITRL